MNSRDAPQTEMGQLQLQEVACTSALLSNANRAEEDEEGKAAQ